MKKSQSKIKIDEIILELREMINESSKRKAFNNHNYHPSIQPSNLKPKLASNIESLIEQTTKLVNHKKNISNQNSQVRGKILAASELLKDQNPLIVDYVKHKIRSELFASQVMLELKRPELFRLQQQKNVLAHQKNLQQKKEQQRRKQIVTSIKQFDTNSRVRVDVHEIDNLIFQEEPESSYLINLNKSETKKVSSKSNEVKNSNLYISQLYNIQQEEKNYSQSKNQLEDLSRLRQEGDIEFTQVVQQIQSQFMDETDKADPKTDGLRKALQKHPHLVKILYQFLKNQFNMMYAKNVLDLVGDIFSGLTNSIETNVKPFTSHQLPDFHLWNNQKKKSQKITKPPLQKISDITQKFKFKAFTIIEQKKVAFDKKKVSERRINKMIGQSKNFHPKKCVLTKNELIYYEEKQSSDGGKFIELTIPQNTKSFEIGLQRIQYERIVKQEGSFFSKKDIDTQIIALKGKTKNFKFENNFLQGAELVDDLKKLMASKVYTICSTLNGLNNLSIFQFINNIKSSEFVLSYDLITSQQIFFKKESRELFIKIICDLFALHQEVTHISLTKSKLLSPQISEFVKELRKMEKLKVINFSHLRLTKQNFQEICQCVNDIQTAKAEIEVNFSDCRLDDDCFVSNVGVFTSFCSKVRHLNISNNFITAKTVQIIKVCLQNINTQIKYLNMSNCPIRELSKLNGLIKESRKLQILQVENSNLGFQEKTVEQVTRFFDFIKKCNPNLKRINLGKNGCLNQEKYSFLQNYWNILTIEELIVDLSVKQRGESDKKLKRTDNVAGKKMDLLMSPVILI